MSPSANRKTSRRSTPEEKISSGCAADGPKATDLMDVAGLARTLNIAPSMIEWLLQHNPTLLPEVTERGAFGPLWSRAVVLQWNVETGNVGLG